MKRILFVDDEPRLLDALRRMLRPLHNEWDMRFVTSGPEALERLAAEPFEIVITDLRMPGMDGSELLAAIRDRCPDTTRIILSGTTDMDVTMQSVAMAHQFLAKPCEPQTLRNTIRRAFALSHLIAAPLQRAISRISVLPSVPTLSQQVMLELRSEDPSIQRVARIVEQDPAMTAKMLQLVNSAFFGFRRHIRTSAEAVVYLGVETMSMLAFSAEMFYEFAPAGLRHFCIETFWRHSLATSALAWKVAVSEGGSLHVAEVALLAGLLHDVGKLVFATAFSQEYDDVLARTEEQGIGELEGERQAFGATHAEAGAYLLWLWGLPDSIVEAVAFHHAPSVCPGGNPVPLTAVHVANVLAGERAGAACGGAPPCLDLGYLERAGRSERVSAWRSMLQTVV
jgi:putative nucleotidyltransferase with HDIG domain